MKREHSVLYNIVHTYENQIRGPRSFLLFNCLIVLWSAAVQSCLLHTQSFLNKPSALAWKHRLILHLTVSIASGSVLFLHAEFI